VLIEKELNPIDATIMKMKDEGYKNSVIAAAIKAMGSPYHPKTISTRIVKIKARQAELNLKCIESETETWTDHEVSLRMFNTS
jgi:hypothetical protein